MQNVIETLKQLFDMREHLHALFLKIKERENAFKKLINLCLKLKDESELDS
jgi:predicted component of type VI protein secretion system